MKKILEKLFQHQPLSQEEAFDILTKISTQSYNPSQIAAFITVYLMRGITVEELAGFRNALLELAMPLDTRGQDTIDLCGTGGDSKNTFNISTLASFVVAGAGYKVVKHGNYGVSSISGSSNVMEYCGYSFTNEESLLLKQLDEANICFCHAPLFHPALKGVAPIRKDLGIKTFFNMLGPLVNPAQPNHQMVGVFSLKLARLYKYLYEQTTKNYAIVYGLSGYDEVSLTSDALIVSNSGEQRIAPSHLGMSMLQESDIYGGESIEESAKIFMSVLQNQASKPQNDVVIANASIAISCFEPNLSLSDCVAIARESLESGKAFTSFQKLINK